MRTLKRILGVLLIFLFGVFIGAAITSAGAMQKLRDSLVGGPEAVMDVIVKRLDRELKLDAEQKRKLQVILDDARIRLRQSRAKVQPEVEATLREAEQRAREILYPEQVKKFDEFVSKGREKWREQESGLPKKVEGPALKGASNDVPIEEVKPAPEGGRETSPATPAPAPNAPPQ